MANSPVYGLVLAGGESRRMGRDKALLLRDGQSQLEYVAALLEGAVERAFVSVRQEQQEEPERGRFSTIADRYEGIGPVAGILSAMDEHPDRSHCVLFTAARAIPLSANSWRAAWCVHARYSFDRTHCCSINRIHTPWTISTRLTTWSVVFWGPQRENNYGALLRDVSRTRGN